MRLVQRLLLGALTVVSILVVGVVVVVDLSLRNEITELSTQQLAREARLLALEWRPGVPPDALADRAGAATGHRVTLIDPLGRVVGDSEFDDAALAGLENHGSRPEVIAARRRGIGSARRRSSSAGDVELYVAVQSGPGIVRVSLPTQELARVFDEARREILLAGLVALIVAMAAALLFSHAVSRPITALRDVARALAGGDLSRRPALSAPGEVGDLAAALHRLAEQLDARLGALQKEESLQAQLFDSLTEGALAVDPRGNVVRINSAGRRLLAVSDPTPFGIDHLPRERVLREALAEALAGRVVDDVETLIGGHTVVITARPLTGGGAVLAVLDLTPTRRLEAVRRDFVANVSHELKTPLTIIAGFAETLEDEELPLDQRARFVQTIIANTGRMQRIVDDLLDLSRIESGGWRPEPTDVDLRTVAMEAMEPARLDAEEKGVALQLELADDAARAWADPTAVRQILGNLVNNAVRHTAAGSVTVFSRRDVDGVVVGVRDTGIGIPPEHLPRIFERFYRVDAGRSREQGGTGLGLAIVRHLAEAHGGRVEAESVPGRGTTVSVTLPGGALGATT